MIDSIINILTYGLGEDNKVLLFIIGFLDSIGKSNIIIIELILSLIVSLIFTIALFWSKFIIAKKKRKIRYWEYWESYKWKTLTTFLIGIIIIFSVFSQGLFINEFGIFLKWFGYDSTYSSGLAFLYGYNQESMLYGFYNTARYIVITVIFIYGCYNGFMYYTVGEIYKGEGKSSSYYKNMKNAVIVFLIALLLLFSILPDSLINWFLDTFGLGNLLM